jgi:Transposase IS200 like
MPWGLTRFHHSGQSHFVTFCCYHRDRSLISDASRRIFELALERVRRSFRLQVYGYVVMPDHVHLLLSEPHLGISPLKPKTGSNGPPVGLSEPQQDTLADALKSLKQGVSRRLIGDAEHFWQIEILRLQHSQLRAVCREAFATFIEIRSGLGCASVRRIGSGAVFATMQPVLRDGSRSSRNGRHENANERRGDFVRR